MAKPMIDDPFGGRQIPEWVGSSPNAKIPDIVRSRIFARTGGRCHLSGIKIVGEWEAEHIVPLSMGGEHRERNLAPASKEKHREKTSLEAKTRAKADRMRRKADGTWPKSKAPLRSRGFASTRGEPA